MSVFSAITICQPYAELILLPFSDDRAKRTENRTWPSRYRGPLLIHAGTSRDWIETRDGVTCQLDLKISSLTFGALVGIVDMIDCLPQEEVEDKYPQLLGHIHIEGPWCHIYANVRRFKKPIPMRGARNIFDVPDYAYGSITEAIKEASK